MIHIRIISADMNDELDIFRLEFFFFFHSKHQHQWKWPIVSCRSSITIRFINNIFCLSILNSKHQFLQILNTFFNFDSTFDMI